MKTNWGAALGGLVLSVFVALVLKWLWDRWWAGQFVFLLFLFANCSSLWKTPSRKFISTALWVGVFLPMVLSARR
jgi:hypothetical protein